MAEPLVYEIFKILDLSISSAIGYLEQHPNETLSDQYQELSSQVQQLRQLIPMLTQAEETLKQQFLDDLKNKPLTNLAELLSQSTPNNYLSTLLKWLLTV
jgi:uncharacterized protein YaaN involved in tellurite resistance